MGGTRVGHRAAAVAALLTPALLLTACGDGSSSTSARSSSSPSAAPSSGVPSVDPSSTDTVSDHAVDRPGPFRAPLQTADILVLRQQTLSPGMVRRIRHLRGVTRVEQFSWAQASIEDHAINVAAVDPATYRNFTIGRVATVPARVEPGRRR